jgi:hypothetical protein
MDINEIQKTLLLEHEKIEVELITALQAHRNNYAYLSTQYNELTKEIGIKKEALHDIRIKLNKYNKGK